MTNAKDIWIIALCAVVIMLTVILVAFAAQAAEDFKKIKTYEAELSELSENVECLKSENTQLSLTVRDLKDCNYILQSKVNTIEVLKSSAKRAYTTLSKDTVSQTKIEPEPETITLSTEYLSLPTGMTNTYRCEDFRKFTNTKSDQYQLQLECATDMDTGIRIYRKNNIVYLCCALGGAYASSIGEAYEVTLKCGTVFNIISSDFKHADQMTAPDPFDFGDPDINYDKQTATNVIEFVYDKKIVPKKVIMAGTMSALDIFGGLYGDGGNIVSMRKLGKVWTK